MDEECVSIISNNSFTTVDSQESEELNVKPFGFRWVFKTKRNPDGSRRYMACLAIKAFVQTDLVSHMLLLES